MLANPKKMLLLKCLTQYARKFGKLSNSHRTGKVFTLIPRAMTNNVQTTTQYDHFTC